LNGLADDMRIYSRALGEDEIASLFFEGGWPVRQISLPSSIHIKQGNTQQLHVSVVPADAPKDKLVYSSGNPSIATIDNNGLISAHTTGNVLITATTENGSVSASATVIVTADLAAISSINIADSARTLIVGNSAKLASSYLPRPAFTSEMHWESSNVLVASVQNDGTVTALDKGTALLYLYADNSKTIKDSISITVLPSQIPIAIGPDTANFAFKATTQQNGVWQASDTLKINMSLFFTDDDTLSYTFSPATNPSDTMQLRAYGSLLNVFQSDTVAQKNILFVSIKATDIHGQSASQLVAVRISEEPDRQPVVDSVPNIVLYQFRQTASVNLAQYITDDYTPFDQLKYSDISSQKGETAINRGVLTIKHNLVEDSEKEKDFNDTITFKVLDSRNQATEVIVPYTYRYVENRAPVSTYSINDTLVQVSDTIIVLDLSNYITDDYTPVDKLKWEHVSSKNLNINLSGSILSVFANNSSWFDSENIVVRAIDEADAKGVMTIQFRRDGNNKGKPLVDFDLSYNGESLPSILQKGSLIYAKILDKSNDSIAFPKWTWEFSNSDTTISVNGSANESFAMNTIGLYSVKLLATNNMGTTTVFKQNVVNVVGIVADRTLICRDSVVVLRSSDTTAGNLYQWSNGAITPSITVSPTETAKYSVAITKANATVRDTIAISVLQPISKIANDTTICGGIGQGVVFEPKGFSSIFWKGAATHAPSHTAAAADTVIVEAWIDNKGTCPAVKDTIIVSVYDPIEIGLPDTLALCRGINDTLIAKGGSKAADYIWNVSHNRGDTLVVSANGTYIVTVTAANGCKYSDSTLVIKNSLPVVSATASKDTVCKGETVSLSAQAATGVGLAWSVGVAEDGTVLPTVIGANTYTVTATSEHGCKATANVKVAVLEVPVVSIVASSDTVCSGSSLTLTATGAKSYIWSGGITNGVEFTPAASGKYFVTGTIDKGCAGIDSIAIAVLDLPTVSIVASRDSICQGDSLSLNATGGASATWNAGVVNNSLFIPDVTKTYTATVADAHGCKAKDSIKIHVFALPTVTATASKDQVCLGDSVLLSATGAKEYIWDAALSTDNYITPTSVKTETYSVSATDSLGCKATASVSVTINAIPVLTISGRDALDTICKNSSIVLFADGADTFVWSHGKDNGASFTPDTTDTYIVVGTSKGCSSKDSVTVAVSATSAKPITLNTESKIDICQNGSVTLTASGIFAFEWNNGIKNGEAFVPDTTATYIVTGVDANKCVTMESVTVTVNALPVISISPMDTTICPSIPVTLTATGAANYKWDNAVENGIAFSPSATKTYSVTGTDANGCVGTAATKVSIHQTFAEQIGVVTASEDGKSIVIAWEPTKGKHLARYELERFEKIVGDSDSYAKIKTFNATDSSYFVDMNVNQNTQSYKYRLLSFDSVCPAAYTASNVHSSIHLATSTGIEENVVNFQWTPYKGLDINTYYFYAFKNGEEVETETYNITTEERNSSIVQRSFDRHNKDYKYKIGFVLPAEFSAGRLKSDSGPYSQSLSNLSEALAEGTNLVIAKNGIVIFPVPAQEILYVVSSGELLSATVQSAAGQVVLSHTGSSPVDVSRLAPGTYSIKLVTENSEALLQFVKQ
jgi:hypothetical protein